MLGKAIGSATVACVQATIMLVLAPFLGVKLSFMMIIELIPMLVILSMSISGLGVLIASRMRSQQGFQIIVQMIIFPLIYLSGVFFPVNNVPAWLEIVSKLNPLTYGVDAVRQLFLSGNVAASGGAVSTIGVTVMGHTMSILEDVLVVLAIGIVLLVAATWSFSKQE